MNCQEFKIWIERNPLPGTTGSLPLEAINHLQNCNSCFEAYHELINTLEIPEQEMGHQAGPYFYTRLKQRMVNRQNQWDVWGIPARLWQPVLFFLLVFVGISLGIFTGNRAGIADAKDEMQSPDSTIQILADEYYMSDFTISYESEYYGNNAR